MIQTLSDVGKWCRQAGARILKDRHKDLLAGSLTILLLSLIPLSSNAQAIKYVASIPESGSTVDSFSNISLVFDLSEIEEAYGGVGQWGVSYNASYNAKLPSKEKSAVLYKGKMEDGEVIDRLSTRLSASESGNTLVMAFNDVEITPNQEYTIVVTYEVYPTNVIDATKNDNTPTLVLKDNPIVLTFFGGENAKKVLTASSNSIKVNETYESLPEIKVGFNYDVAVNAGAKASVYEGTDLVAESASISVDPSDSKTILVNFPETPLYTSHSYNFVIPEGCVSIADENDIVNKEVAITIQGASYRYFGVANGVNPANNSVSILSDIYIPFDFPNTSSKTYGVKDIYDTLTVYLYEGTDTEGEPLQTLIAEGAPDCLGIIIRPNNALKAGTEYTVVIPEGTVKAYDMDYRQPPILRMP